MRKAMRTSKAGLALLVLGQLAALAQWTCHQALLTAPPGSTITVFANPTFISANGGISVISALVIEPAGTPVADGTVVQFFTNLGRIDEQGKTNDGVARVNLVADSRSGPACVTAFSGGPATGGGGSPSPTPTPTATPSPSPGASRLAVSSESLALARAGDCSGVSVFIGNINAKSVLVTAFPPRLTDRRATLITANVFDVDGNPVASVPIIFTVDAASGVLTEFMDSQGSPTFTDNNGQAQDVMRTRYPSDATPKTVTVTASTPIDKVSGSVMVQIN